MRIIEELMGIHDTIPALTDKHGRQRAALREAITLLRDRNKEIYDFPEFKRRVDMYVEDNAAHPMPVAASAFTSPMLWAEAIHYANNHGVDLEILSVRHREREEVPTYE